MLDVRRVLVLAVMVGAAGAIAFALLAPPTAFDAILAHLIGQPGIASTTEWQRIVAAIGAALGALALGVGVFRVRGHVLPATKSRIGPLVALGVLASMNALALAHRVGVVPGDVHPPRWALRVAACLVCVGCASFLVRRSSQQTSIPGWLAAAAGAGYGCYSALWHCCRPAWATSPGALLWFSALALTLGTVGRLGATLRPGRGEVAGAFVFALAYPFHSIPFFVQNLAGGAFATALVRTTGSGWSPALFLATAYVTHTTLPFLGPAAVAPSAILLAACALLTARAAKHAPP